MSNGETLKEGKIKFYNEPKGYGFVVEDGSEKEIFFHRSRVKGEFTRKDQDKKVTFKLSDGKKGIEAVDVKLK